LLSDNGVVDELGIGEKNGEDPLCPSNAHR
jgi:hypothetical protein